jgi:hypothetical protein
MVANRKLRLPISKSRTKPTTFLHYNPETGEFTWRTDCNKGIAVEKAGLIDPSNGYLRINIWNVLYYGHRLAWLFSTGEWPESALDHINGIKTDNRISNLRLASQRLNARNTLGRSKTGFKGVYKDKKNFVAQICVDGRKKHLGTFDTPEEAHIAYVDAAKLHFGEFANTKHKTRRDKASKRDD